MIEAKLKARDDEVLREGSDEDDGYVQQGDVDDIGHKMPELKSDMPKKIQKVSATHRR